MLKIAIAFVVFAAMAIFVIMKGGDSLDMGGEKHGAEAVHAPAPGASAPAAGTSAPAAGTSAAAPVAKH